MTQTHSAPGNVLKHFTARAERYDRSSSWCTDPKLGELVLQLVGPRQTDQVLDVACGTGLVSKLFRGRVAKTTGVDLTRAMFEQARENVDSLVEGRGEDLPFPDNAFDIVVSRQGIQFMDDVGAVAEMARVVRPGGRICLIQLCAYGAEDKDEYFEVLRLRNPARRNFYLREDIVRLLESVGCRILQQRDYVSREDVDVWANNGAIGAEACAAIRAVYQQASAAFKRLHAIELDQTTGTLTDNMLFTIAVGEKPLAPP